MTMENMVEINNRLEKEEKKEFEKEKNKDYQATLRDRSKGGINVGVRILALFQYFRRKNKIPEEMLPYFKEFLGSRTIEAKNFMIYYNTAIKNEEQRLGDLNFE